MATFEKYSMPQKYQREFLESLNDLSADGQFNRMRDELNRLERDYAAAIEIFKLIQQRDTLIQVNYTFIHTS